MTTRIWILTEQGRLQERMPLELVQWLESEGHPVRLVVADAGPALSMLDPFRKPSSTSPWADLAPNDLVVGRVRSGYAMALLKEAEARGATTFNSWSAVSKVQDIVRRTLALRARGLPVPQTWLARTPQDLRSLPDSVYPLTLRHATAARDEGVVCWGPDDFDPLDWPGSPLLAQRHLTAATWELRLLVAGGNVWAQRRTMAWATRSQPPQLVPVSAAQKALVQACRDLFLRLPLFGLTVVNSADGQIILDVEDFPNYDGIDEAPSVIGRLLLAELSRRERAAPLIGSYE